MDLIQQQLAAVNQRIRQAEADYLRTPSSVKLLAVSKTRSAQDIEAALEAGQMCFGESYLREALEKIEQLSTYSLEWHYIGRIQSNKTKLIAEHFDWVHSVVDVKHARRLSNQRPSLLQPLKVCLQINVSGEKTKAGIAPEQAQEVTAVIRDLPNLQLCGLMTLPAPAETLDQRRQPFRELRALRDRLRAPDLPLATLSMGMSDDLEAAIAEGATIVRVGTAIFGPRR